MTRDEALAECRRPAEGHSDHATHSWLPRPSHADDPRPPMWRDVGGPYAGG
jgi:hypothetical protein